MFSKRSYSFLPFWQPYRDYASSRVRGIFPAHALNQSGGARAEVGWIEGADLYLVIQLCSDRILERLKAVRGETTIAYVVCDRQFNDRTSRAGVCPYYRFAELYDLCDYIIAPTDRLKCEIGSRFAQKPIYVIPDCQDYAEQTCAALVPENQTAIWFGNPGDNNFKSAQPFLKNMVSDGFDILIVSRPEYFYGQMEPLGKIVPWHYETFVDTLRRASFSLIAYDAQANYKSDNRLVTSIMNGVPSIITGECESSDTLVRLGLEYAVVKAPSDLRQAIKAIQNPALRIRYISTMQRHFAAKLSAEAIAARYFKLPCLRSKLTSTVVV